MATFQQPSAEVRGALDRSRLHLESGQQSGAAACFAFESLAGLHLDGVVLTGAMLQETDLSRCSLVAAEVCSATANGALFLEADVSRANFKKTSLVEASFVGATAQGTRFQDCPLNTTAFDGADLRDADFEHAVLVNASFRSADLRRATLTRATVRGADFTAANLEGAVFDSTVLDGSTRFANCVGLEKAVVRSVITDQGVLHSEAACEHLLQMARGAD